ncbi:hypothetical protein ACSHWH_00005, partial [Leucobacter sp. W1478]
RIHPYNQGTNTPLSAPLAPLLPHKQAIPRAKIDETTKKRSTQVYGADPTLTEKLGLERQWLHAMRLGFKHPGSGEHVEFNSSYPADLQHALDVLQGV